MVAVNGHPLEDKIICQSNYLYVEEITYVN